VVWLAFKGAKRPKQLQHKLIVLGLNGSKGKRTLEHWARCFGKSGVCASKQVVSILSRL